jgi:hypothetical protein
MTFLKRAGLLAIVAALIAIAAPTAQAQTAPGFGEFAGCPDEADIQLCFRSEVNGGNIQIGNTNTPITRQIVLSGGLEPDFDLVFNSQGGLNAPPLNVPGGLSGITGLPEFLINILTLGAHQVHAQATLVGTPKVLFEPTTLGLQLPLRIRLLNPFLRSGCSIGSASSPVLLNLTTGTTNPPPPNTPITGVANEFVDVPPGIVQSTGNVFVDNAFSAPAASGCDLIGFGLINGLVNTRVGLPSPAGRNTARMSNTTVKLAEASLVYP